jgi:hypothetical protein
MMCKGLINNIATDLLIDTGSVYTLISYNLLKDRATTNQSKLFASSCKSTGVSANTDKIDIHGISDVPCTSLIILHLIMHILSQGFDF